MSVIVGRALKDAREAKRITLDQVSEELHIRVAYLQAIERGSTELLPSPVQGRGFVRIYSDFLGLNTQEVLRVWDNPEQPDAPIQQVPAGAQMPQRSPVPATNLTQKPSDNAQQIFQEIGAELKQRRDNLGLSLEDCEQQTMVRREYLDALEKGQYERLISFVQARGMLNNYAVFLNMNTDDVMLRFANALQLLNISTNQSHVAKQTKKEPVKQKGRLARFFTLDLLIGVVVLLAMAGLIIYSVVTISALRSAGLTPTLDMNVSLLDQSDGGTPAPGDLATATATPLPELIVNPNTLVTEVEEAPEELTGLIQISISSNQRSYLRVVSDGEEVFRGRTLPGDFYQFDAMTMLEVSTGNAAAISITYNQQNLGIMGNLGQVGVYQFLPQMVVTPTLQYTLTPTSTRTPTPTMMGEMPTITPYIP